MVVVPLSKATHNASETPASTADSRRWLRMAAAGTLVASGALLIAGKRRAGLVTALTGAALVMIEQREAVSKFWNALPGYLGAIQSVARPRASCGGRYLGAGREVAPGVEQVTPSPSPALFQSPTSLFGPPRIKPVQSQIWLNSANPANSASSTVSDQFLRSTR